ncbi:unnamed protein product [Laminaria digitata]
MYDGMLVTSVGQQGSSLEAVYTVPENICLPRETSGGDGGKAFLSCGATTAIFDEVSTLAMVIADKTYRPGVSISLSCQMFHPVRPGERVTFKSRGLKMGGRLGYGEASMYREDGKLAATGRHVKYLPMGRAWDLTATPLLFPVATKWMVRQHERWLKDPHRTKARRERRRHEIGDGGGIPTGEHLVDMFKLEHFERYEGGKATEEYFGDANLAQGQEEEEGEIRSAEAEVLITRRKCNYMPGTMHGGAIAVAAEEIARRCPPSPLPVDDASVLGNPSIQYMEVHYMSPIKRRAGLAAVSAAANTGINVTRVGLSEAGGTEGGVLCAEAVLLWGQKEGV